jgi:hypothetical protein
MLATLLLFCSYGLVGLDPSDRDTASGEVSPLKKIKFKNK